MGFTMRVSLSFMFIPDCLKKIEIPRTVKSVFCSHFQEPPTLHTSNSNGIEQQPLDLIAVLLCKKQRTEVKLNHCSLGTPPMGSLPGFSQSELAVPLTAPPAYFCFYTQLCNNHLRGYLCFRWSDRSSRAEVLS